MNHSNINSPLCKSKRTRAPNFTPEETNHLLNLMENYRAIIDNNKIDRASVNDKCRAWQTITEKYNSTTLSHERTMETLKGLWKNHKRINNTRPMKQVSEANPNSNIIKNEVCQGWEILVDENENGSHTDSEDFFGTHNEDWTEKQNVSSEREDENTESRSENSTEKRKEKEELYEIQKELLQTQLINAREKLEHDRKMRQIELEERDRETAHNVMKRDLELQILSDRKLTVSVCDEVLNS